MPQSSEINPRDAKKVQHTQMIHKSYQQNEKKNHVITSVDTESTLSKAPHSS